MSEQAYVTSPVGRLVWSNLWKGETTGYQGKPLLDRQGRSRTEWSIGFAIQKGPEFNAFWAQIAVKAQLDFPAGEWQLPNFSWKLKDGDAPDQIGKEGRAGHFVLRLASGFPPSVFDTSYAQIIDPKMVVPGDYLQLNIGVQGNGDNATGKPGIYLNLGLVLFMAKGEPIIAGPTPEQVFGPPQPVAAPMMPMPGTAVPVAPQPVAAPMMPLSVPVAPQPAMPGTAVPVAPQPAMPGTAVPVAPQPVAAPMAPMPGTAVPVAPQPVAAPMAPMPSTAVPVAPQPAMPGTAVPMPLQPAPPAGTNLGQPAVPVTQPPQPGVPTAAPGFLTPGKPQQ